MSKNNFSPFPFFTSKDEQTKWYAYGRDYVYLCPDGGILPFQIQRGHLGAYEKGDEITTFFSTLEAGILSTGTPALANNGSFRTNVIRVDGYEYPRIFVEGVPNGRFSDKEGNLIDGVMASFETIDGEIVGTFGQYPEYSSKYTGEIVFPDTTTFLYIRYAGTKYYKAKISTTTPRGIESVFVKNADTDEVLFSIPVSSFNLVADSSNVYDYIVCNGIFDTYKGQGATKMYIELSDGTNTFYSAYFGWGNPCLSIEWRDKNDLIFREGMISYANGYYNRMYFNAELGMPSYEFEEEVTERNGYSYPLSQVSYKKYKFNILAPEEVCDVMRLIRLSDVVCVRTEGRRFYATSFLITPEWQEQGYLASVACEFCTDTMVKKNGKAYAIASGDYNEDYNEDYNK
jgi:hypothetical protein